MTRSGVPLGTGAGRLPDAPPGDWSERPVRQATAGVAGVRIWRALGGAAILALALIPSKALAQEVEFDGDILAACLADGGAETCIGSGAAACTSSDFRGSNVGYGLCFGAELAWWEATLDQTYGAVAAARAARDADLRELGSAVPPSGPALRAAQQAWAVWRDATCDYVGTTWGGGSGTGPAMTECAMEMTAEQALRLRRDLREMGE